MISRADEHKLLAEPRQVKSGVGVDVRRAHGGMSRVLAGDIVNWPRSALQATGRCGGLVSSFRFAG